MPDAFRAIRLEKTEAGPKASIVELSRDDLMPGDVTVRVDYSTINYKDGLAITGKSPIVRTYPLIPGIDLAGVVEASDDARYAPGDRVILNGWGAGVSHHGGLSQIARVPGDWLVKAPAGIDNARAMALGTAGYTAMLCVIALERNGVTPDKGEIIVTGAAGGVGSVAIALLSKLGYRVLASTGRLDTEGDFLRGLGAADLIDRNELSSPGKPMAAERWAGGVDAVGSHTLVNVLAATRYGGAVAACGLAQGLDLPGSVAPFILRNVTLAGIDSVNRPRADREEAWSRLARDLDLSLLDKLTQRAGLADAPQLAQDILEGKVRGRVVIDVNA